MLSQKNQIRAAIFVAALGYFVDVYDLLLFSIVRVASLESLGLKGEELTNVGLQLLNWQMAGMLIGGVLWGILGDKKGRLTVLFGSIFLYSVANIANGFVHSVGLYATLRFIAGIGLAGELGAGITLVAEMMPKEKRGYGTTVVATVGVMGAIVAAVVGDLFPWRTAYIIGGVLGLSLLLVRIGVTESGMFKITQNNDCDKGNLWMLVNKKERFKRYFYSLISGIPIWFALGILVTFSPEIGTALGIVEPVSASKSVFYAYIGLVLGDLSTGLISQYMKSRKKVLAGFVVLTAICCTVILNAHGITPKVYYVLCVPLGFSIGYWAIFITMAAEQFGTNLRSTVATSVPNFVRGSVVPISFAFNALKIHTGVLQASLIVGLSCCAIALFGISGLKETHGKDLDFIEE